jgi:hypothetical protein
MKQEMNKNLFLGSPNFILNHEIEPWKVEKAESIFFLSFVIIEKYLFKAWPWISTEMMEKFEKCIFIGKKNHTLRLHYYFEVWKKQISIFLNQSFFSFLPFQLRTDRTVKFDLIYCNRQYKKKQTHFCKKKMPS